MNRTPGEAGALWYDDEAGPMVRPYTVTRGRTQPDGQAAAVDLIAIVIAEPPDDDDDGRDGRGPDGGGDAGAVLDDEHLALLERCRAGPLSVAELASEADLPLGVVRVLLGDLLESGQLRVTRPIAPAELPDVGLLHHVISGLRSL